MVDIILDIERHSVLGMQIDYLEEIEKVLFIFLLPAGRISLHDSVHIVTSATTTKTDKLTRAFFIFYDQAYTINVQYSMPD